MDNNLSILYEQLEYSDKTIMVVFKYVFCLYYMINIGIVIIYCHII